MTILIVEVGRGFLVFVAIIAQERCELGNNRGHREIPCVLCLILFYCRRE